MFPLAVFLVIRLCFAPDSARMPSLRGVGTDDPVPVTMLLITLLEAADNSMPS